jgi:hypothetical protein
MIDARWQDTEEKLASLDTDVSPFSKKWRHGADEPPTENGTTAQSTGGWVRPAALPQLSPYDDMRLALETSQRAADAQSPETPVFDPQRMHEELQKRLERVVLGRTPVENAENMSVVYDPKESKDSTVKESKSRRKSKSKDPKAKKERKQKKHPKCDQSQSDVVQGETATSVDCVGTDETEAEAAASKEQGVQVGNLGEAGELERLQTSSSSAADSKERKKPSKRTSLKSKAKIIQPLDAPSSEPTISVADLPNSMSSPSNANAQAQIVQLETDENPAPSMRWGMGAASQLLKQSNISTSTWASLSALGQYMQYGEGVDGASATMGESQGSAPQPNTTEGSEESKSALDEEPATTSAHGLADAGAESEQGELLEKSAQEKKEKESSKGLVGALLQAKERRTTAPKPPAVVHGKAAPAKPTAVANGVANGVTPGVQPPSQPLAPQMNGTAAKMMPRAPGKMRPPGPNGPVDLSNYYVRLSTFARWPRRDIPPEPLARAGFYYSGREHSDLCACFCCRGTMYDWDAGDDPWLEHKKMNPRCMFIQRCPPPNRGPPNQGVPPQHKAAGPSQQVAAKQEVSPPQMTSQPAQPAQPAQPVPEQGKQLDHVQPVPCQAPLAKEEGRKPVEQADSFVQSQPAQPHKPSVEQNGLQTPTQQLAASTHAPQKPSRPSSTPNLRAPTPGLMPSVCAAPAAPAAGTASANELDSNAAATSLATAVDVEATPTVEVLDANAGLTSDPG